MDPLQGSSDSLERVSRLPTNMGAAPAIAIYLSIGSKYVYSMLTPRMAKALGGCCSFDCVGVVMSVVVRRMLFACYFDGFFWQFDEIYYHYWR